MTGWALYAIGVVASIGMFVFGFKRQQLGYTVVWCRGKESPTAVLVALAGFAVFPVINLMLPVALLLWLACDE